MLARSSTIRHKSSGVTLDTPLLIPSFSSKGFAVSKKENKSEIGKILDTASEFVTDVYLISAYDVHYGNVPDAPHLPLKPELIFLDSGGYEISTDRDYAGVIDAFPAPQHWDTTLWLSVLSNWPDDVPIVAISYDHHGARHPFLDQVRDARKHFKACPKQLHLFLLKPETTDQTLLTQALRSAIAHVDELGSFDLIGLTEKELGRSALDRMANIARLRQALDAASIPNPIHIFGALDPLSVCLYYIAGAEVFDGLTWLRYAYDNGRCVYQHNYGTLHYGVNVRNDDQMKAQLMSRNYYYLQDLALRMRDYESTKKWKKFSPHEKFIQDAYDSLQTRLKKKAK